MAKVSLKTIIFLHEHNNAVPKVEAKGRKEHYYWPTIYRSIYTDYCIIKGKFYILPSIHLLMIKGIYIYHA